MSSPYDQTTPRLGSIALRAPRLTARQERPSPLCSPILGGTDVLSRTMPVRPALASPGSLRFGRESELLDANAMQQRDARRADPLIWTMQSPLRSPQEQHLCTPRPYTHVVSRVPMMPVPAPVTFMQATLAPESWGYTSSKLHTVHRRRSLAT